MATLTIKKMPAARRLVTLECDWPIWTEDLILVLFYLHGFMSHATSGLLGA